MTDTPSDPPPSVRPIRYKGEPLDAERGPGLGCFRFQIVLLAVLIVLTPLSVAWDAPSWVSIVLLFAVIVLLLVAGQTIIFLLRLIAADRREGRRRPLASRTRTVGELEDERVGTASDERSSTADDERSRTADGEHAGTVDDAADDAPGARPPVEGPMRQ